MKAWNIRWSRRIGIVVSACALAAARVDARPAPRPAPPRPAIPQPPSVVPAFLPAPPAGGRWRLAWNDEFNGLQLDPAKWIYHEEGRRRDGWWSRKAVSLNGRGQLVLSVLKDQGRYLSACISTQGRYETAFGYFEIRVKFQTQPGHWTAFWMMNAAMSHDGPNGREGTELDIFEKPTLDDNLEHTLHWGGYGRTHDKDHRTVKIEGLSSGWHTVGLLWTPDEYVFYVDGRETWRTRAGGVSQRPEYMILSSEIGDWAGKITDARLPDEWSVDYVRVYQWTAPADRPPAGE